MNDNLETLEWEALTEVLREEMQEYGAMLNLLRKQQACILGRDPDGVLNLLPDLNRQTERCSELRFKRERMTGELAHSYGQSRQLRLSEILNLIPSRTGTLVSGLVEEINATLKRLQRTARQNQMLLDRSVDLAGRIVRLLQPESVTRTYTRRGNMNLRAPSQGACMRKTV